MTMTAYFSSDVNDRSQRMPLVISDVFRARVRAGQVNRPQRPGVAGIAACNQQNGNIAGYGQVNQSNGENPAPDNYSASLIQN